MNESPCKYLWTMYIQYLYNEEQADSISVLEHFASSSERDTSLSSGYECSVLLCVCLRWERAGGCILFRTGVEQLRILAMICMQTTKHHDYYTRSARHPRKKITKASPLRVCRLHVNKQTSGRAKNIEPNNALTFMAGRLYIPGWLRLMEAWSAAAAQCITYLNRLQFAHRRAMYVRSLPFAEPTAARVDKWKICCLLEKQTLLPWFITLMPVSFWVDCKKWGIL